MEKHEESHLIHYFVDNEKHASSSRVLTVQQILASATLDPSTHYLIELHGHHQVPHQNLAEELHLHDCEKFISVFTGPTPVS